MIGSWVIALTRSGGGVYMKPKYLPHFREWRYKYSETCWNDPLWKDHFPISENFYLPLDSMQNWTFLQWPPVWKDHFSWHLGWSFQTGFTVIVETSLYLKWLKFRTVLENDQEFSQQLVLHCRLWHSSMSFEHTFLVFKWGILLCCLFHFNQILFPPTCTSTGLSQRV